MAYTFLKRPGSGHRQVASSKRTRSTWPAQRSTRPKAKGVNLLLPVDNILADKFAPDAKTQILTETENFPADWQGLDIGPKTIEPSKK